MTHFSVGATYVAMGLSRDNMMGQDSVIECVAEDQIRAYTSFTNTAGARGSPRIDVRMIKSCLNQFLKLLL